MKTQDIDALLHYKLNFPKGNTSYNTTNILDIQRNIPWISSRKVTELMSHVPFYNTSTLHYVVNN